MFGFVRNLSQHDLDNGQFSVYLVVTQLNPLLNV